MEARSIALRGRALYVAAIATLCSTTVACYACWYAQRRTLDEYCARRRDLDQGGWCNDYDYASGGLPSISATACFQPAHQILGAGLLLLSALLSCAAVLLHKALALQREAKQELVSQPCSRLRIAGASTLVGTAALAGVGFVSVCVSFTWHYALTAIAFVCLFAEALFITWEQVDRHERKGYIKRRVLRAFVGACAIFAVAATIMRYANGADSTLIIRVLFPVAEWTAVCSYVGILCCYAWHDFASNLAQSHATGSDSCLEGSPEPPDI